MTDTGVTGAATADTQKNLAERFLTKAGEALADLAEVKVVTLVGAVDMTITSKGDSTVTRLDDQDVKGDAIVTVMKLVDGDVTTVIAENLLGNAELRAFHAAQVAASAQVLTANLKALVGVAQQLLYRANP